MNYTLITGASSGIGLELAQIALRENRNLLLVAREKKKLEAVKKQMLRSIDAANPKGSQYTTNENLKIQILALDLTKSSSAQKIYDFCEKQNIFVNELINNAGFGDYGKFAKSDLNRQLNMIHVNIRALTELTHLFLPNMIKHNEGKIMNLGSVASFLPGPNMSVYYASKNYVLRFSEALSEELSNSNITVTCLCPGPTATNFATSALADKTKIFSGNLPSARMVSEFGWYHMQAGTRIAVFGRTNRLILQLARFVPRNTLTKLVKKFQR